MNCTLAVDFTLPRQEKQPPIANNRIYNILRHHNSKDISHAESSLTWVVPATANSKGKLTNETLDLSHVDLSHARLGHLDHQNVNGYEDVKSALISPRPKTKGLCEPCTVAERKAGQHNSHIRRGKCRLHLVLPDIIGLFHCGRGRGRHPAAQSPEDITLRLFSCLRPST